jgi:hypothetical protein
VGDARDVLFRSMYVLKNVFLVSGVLTISSYKDLLSPWLFINADTRKYVLKGEIHP